MDTVTIQIAKPEETDFEFVINFRCQKGNKCHTDSVISDDVDKLRNLTEIVDILCQQIDDRNQTEPAARI